jgi:ADP-heptose:LPS heptosyltransferase
MLLDAGPHLTDWEETAAAIECLDLVISVDTAVAHVAGAMGKRVWTMLPYSPDWRWGLSGPATAWYPTMRLFRQPGIGDWRSVISSVQGELERFARTQPF